jgi:hypothetical protein
MAIKDGEWEPSRWELAFAKSWLKIAARMVEDPEVVEMVQKIVSKFRPTTFWSPPITGGTSIPTPSVPYTYNNSCDEGTSNA